jgi:hypothetical protein
MTKHFPASANRHQKNGAHCGQFWCGFFRSLMGSGVIRESIKRLQERHLAMKSAVRQQRLDGLKADAMQMQCMSNHSHNHNPHYVRK